MRIIAACDAARCPEELNRIREENRETDLFLYLGEDPSPHPGWSVVSAGCILTLATHRILVAPAIRGLKEAAARAGSLGCDLLLRFSPYVAWCVEIGDVLVVDPGSLRHSANRMPRSYASLELQPDHSPACTIQWLQRPAQGLESRFELSLGQGGKGDTDA